MDFTISTVTEDDLGDLLPLLRGYCDFYEVPVTDEQLLTISRALIADPAREGVQLLARAATTERTALGFATVYWTWTTTRGGRLAVMNDLFVSPDARGGGIADALILASRDRAREHGAVDLEWMTALDNHRAQTVYDRVGGQRSQWLSYSLEITA
jgi:GNAT superfamily N-acetyltransferase